ncbi:hypothetical protein SPFM12_00111 [Salmonella phage SPFM12]|nr:hypothetical protein SPFM12_00111 [Salmonella phage SPFM12]
MGYQQDPGTGGGTVDPDDNNALGMDKLTLNGTTLLTTTALTRFMEWKAGINTLRIESTGSTLKSNGSVVLACGYADTTGTRALFRSPAGESEIVFSAEAFISKWVSKESKGVFNATISGTRQLTSEVRALGLQQSDIDKYGAHPVNLKTPDTFLAYGKTLFNYPGHIASTNPHGTTAAQAREKLTELKDAVLGLGTEIATYVASAVHDVELDAGAANEQIPSLYPATPAAVAWSDMLNKNELIKALNNPTAADWLLLGNRVFEGQMLGGTFYSGLIEMLEVTTPVFCGVHLINPKLRGAVPLTRGTDYELEYALTPLDDSMLDHRPFFEGLVVRLAGSSIECHFIEERIIDSDNPNDRVVRD